MPTARSWSLKSQELLVKLRSNDSTCPHCLLIDTINTLAFLFLFDLINVINELLIIVFVATNHVVYAPFGI